MSYPRRAAPWGGLLVLVAALGAEDPPTLSNRITRVLVYSQGARVTRSAEGQVPAGRSRLDLRDLPAGIVPDSLRVRLAPGSEGRLLSTREILLPATAVDVGRQANLVAQRDQMDLARQGAEDERCQLAGSLELLRAIALPPLQEGGANHAPLPQIAPGPWHSTTSFVGQETTRILNRLRVLNADIETKDAALATLSAEIARLEERRRPACLTLRLEVERPAAGPLALVVDYSVSQAAWYPAYTVAVDGATGKGELVRSAWVAQNSGEDWRDVVLEVSSGLPVRVVEAPQLTVWRIGTATPGLEPPVAGSRPPDSDSILRPQALVAAQGAFLDHPFARQNQRLTDSFNAEMGGSGAFMALGAGGGGAGALGNRVGGSRKRAVARFGGTKQSESAVQSNLGFLTATQEENGSWSSSRHGGQAGLDEADTALVLLCFLGSGCDHRTPGPSKQTIGKGLTWLLSRIQADGSVGRHLSTHAYATTVFCEALALTGDPALREPALRCVHQLGRRLLAAPWPLQSGLAGRTWPDHPANLAAVTMALKSAKAAGLETDPVVWLRLLGDVAELERSGSDPLTSSAALSTRILLGQDSQEPGLRNVLARMLAALPLRWQRGALDFRMILYGTQSAFQVGGQAWTTWNSQVRDLVVSHQQHDGEHPGGWDPIGSDCLAGGSRVYAAALLTLSLQTYYRYHPVGTRLASGEERRNVAGGGGQWISPYLSAAGRDLRLAAAQREAVPTDGSWRPLVLDRRPIDLRLEHLCMPVVYRGAYLLGSLAWNDPLPLLAGEARIQLGGDSLGSVFIDTRASGQELVVPLGQDGLVEVERRSRVRESGTGFREQLRRSDYTVEITVANRRQVPIDLVLRDRVPRPADSRIRVLDLACTPEPQGYDPQSSTGELRFRLNVPPGKTQTATIAYAVELPAELQPIAQEAGHE